MRILWLHTKWWNLSHLHLHVIFLFKTNKKKCLNKACVSTHTHTDLEYYLHWPTTHEHKAYSVIGWCTHLLGVLCYGSSHGSFVCSRVGTWELEMLERRKRNKKEIGRHRIVTGGQLDAYYMLNFEFWIHLCLIFMCFYSPIQKGEEGKRLL